MLEHKRLFEFAGEDPTVLGLKLAAEAAKDPVYFDDMVGMPVVLDSQGINTILRDGETFSTSIYGHGLMKGALVAQTGDAHTQMRKLYNAFFAPQKIRMYEESIVTPAVRKAIDELGQQAQPDLIDHFSIVVPQQVVSALFGLPSEDIAKNDELVRTMLLAIIRPQDPEIAAAGQKAYDQMQAGLQAIAARELENPSDNLLGEIAKALIAEGNGNVDACERVVFTLILGSYETTIWGIAVAMGALLKHPESLARVREDPASTPKAIEEAWRWCGTAIGGVRMVTRDVEVAGHAFTAGTVLQVGMLAPQYDQAIYDKPEIYDIERPAKTMIFGGGPHYCVGAPLARMETRVAINELLARYPNIRLDTERPAPKYMVGVRNSIAVGPDYLPVVLA